MQHHNLVVIGSSTGGPKTLEKIFNGFPRINASIIIVQHMPKFINESLCDHLDRVTDMAVKIPGNYEELKSGVCYLAPSEVHLVLENNRQCKLYRGEKVNFVCPSIDVTMNSLMPPIKEQLLGVILTGMGKDGATGLAHIKSIGGHTIAQDQRTSVIYGMPKAAIQTGKVDHVLPANKIQEKICALVN